MILQALVQHYETLAQKGEISRLGWNPLEVSYALNINENGELLSLLSLKTEQQSGKKTRMVSRIVEAPIAEKKTSGSKPHVFCDSNSYILGVDNKGKPKNTKKHFQDSRIRHEQVLSEVNTPEARAILNFFQNWNPDEAQSHPALQEHWEKIKAETGRFLFFFHHRSVLEYKEIFRAWECEFDKMCNATEDCVAMTCLVTGEMSVIPHIHYAIRGKYIQGSTQSEPALVSFNAPAFCSYGREQNFNAPVGQYASFAYTTVLNHLLANREERVHIGDTTVVCWAETGEKAYQQVGMMGMGMWNTPQNDSDLESKLLRTLSHLAEGNTSDWDGTVLSPETKFYILGLAPNAARISVRFFLQNTFSDFLCNVQAHQKRLEIAKPKLLQFTHISLWHLLRETVNPKSTDKTSSPQMTGQLLQAILQNTRYPSTLLSAVQNRIRAECEITYEKAAIIKAYYLQNTHPHCPKEVLTVSLNQESSNIPYVLGRLFFLLESIQQKANPKLNASIKDKYFNSAASTPATIFPRLFELSQKHLKKIAGENFGMKVYYEKEVGKLMDKLGETYPTQLTLHQRGAFQLGYYHQAQYSYSKKEKTNESVED